VRPQLFAFDLTLAEEEDEAQNFKQRVELQEPGKTARQQRRSRGTEASAPLTEAATTDKLDKAGGEGSCRSRGASH